MPSLLQAPGVSARFLDLLAQEPLGRSRILDVGCGAGRLSLALAPVSKWVVGLGLTEGFMMDPEASVSALVFHHPEAKYFKAE